MFRCGRLGTHCILGPWKQKMWFCEEGMFASNRLTIATSMAW